MTPTREQLAELLEEVKRCIYHPQPAEEDNARKKLDHVIACLATPEPAPEAMPLIDIEALITACVPGGQTCDPQEVADAIRERWTREPRR